MPHRDPRPVERTNKLPQKVRALPTWAGAYYTGNPPTFFLRVNLNKSSESFYLVCFLHLNMPWSPSYSFVHFFAYWLSLSSTFCTKANIYWVATYGAWGSHADHRLVTWLMGCFFFPVLDRKQLEAHNGRWKKQRHHYILVCFIMWTQKQNADVEQ